MKAVDLHRPTSMFRQVRDTKSWWTKDNSCGSELVAHAVEMVLKLQLVVRKRQAEMNIEIGAIKCGRE